VTREVPQKVLEGGRTVHKHSKATTAIKNKLQNLDGFDSSQFDEV